MEDKKNLMVELCIETGCGLLVANNGNAQYRVDLMPDEVLEARTMEGEELTDDSPATGYSVGKYPADY